MGTLVKRFFHCGKKFGMDSRILCNVYKCTTGSITAWYRMTLTMTTLKIGLANLTVILPASSLCSLQLRSNKQTNKQNTKKTSKQRKAKYKAENTQ